MADQNKRMTYEQQRALREQKTERTADRFTADNYGSGRTNGTTTRQRTARQSSARKADARSTRSSQSASRRKSTGQGTTRQSATRQGTARARTNTRSQVTARNQAVDDGQARTANRQASQQSTRDRLARTNYGSTATATRPPVFKIAIAAVLVLAVVLIVQFCSTVTPINVTVNGTQYELRGSKTIQAAIKESGLPINPGDFISLQGNVLEKSAGHPFSATVNETQTNDPEYRLRDGDVINVTDGEDIVEDYDVTEQSVPYSATITGMGSVHELSAGKEGVLETRTGKVSGETVDRQTVDPVNVTCTEYNLNTGASKLIAFTFDDGPSSGYTANILDILKENDAKATFFCIGTEVQAYPDLVKREHDEGHQVCTHSYDHADPVGGTSLALMDAAGQVDEILRGMQTITDVIGGQASRIVRFPGGNISEDLVLNLQPYIDYEIGWNIDTVDWTLPGVESIYQSMISAEPGDIILCHDGGGDREETVEALRRALPYLKSKGYSFVTMDELLARSSRN